MSIFGVIVKIPNETLRLHLYWNWAIGFDDHL